MAIPSTNPLGIPIFHTLTKILPVDLHNIRVRWPHGADICVCRSTHSASSAEKSLVFKGYDRQTS